ncbi:MAG: DarT ssDNA thymidine ADP-ribosyltransferase family protein [bacterium]|nr:DarT ssDNA thymidine ADP-ribosyltransferase family protein [bacterium]MCY3951240.1 DarT ssDNA thymidine ADP-ribosyltransferase family protein [bacterium]MCY4101677.1 DarT ssDNA thymidine ADP-ribosyltransferase family protein [bacterium]
MTWAPEAMPQTADEVRKAPWCPDVVEAAVARGITSIVHFTGIPGLKGILASSAVKARRDLMRDTRLQYVAEENAPDRSRDVLWHDYINMSVTAINRRMFQFSERQHPDAQWVILEFDPEILGDPGVVFCTTNNAYEVAHRCGGLQGFEQMFAERVPWGHYGDVHFRFAYESDRTTDPQAEVLYPFELSLDHLHTVTVRDEETYEAVIAAKATFPHPSEIAELPGAFR